MTAPEFNRPVPLDTLGEQPRELAVSATAEERAALARRFGLLGLDRLEANLAIARNGDEVRVAGTLRAPPCSTVRLGLRSSQYASK